jgi:hypothetical protein
MLSDLLEQFKQGEEKMINLSLNFWQLLLVIFVGITGYLIGHKLAQVLLKIVFTSKLVMVWNMKRQVEQRKIQQKAQRELTYDAFKNLEMFVEQLEKMFPNNQQRKQFFRDFCDNKEMRANTIKNYMAQFSPRPETPKGIIKTDEEGNKLNG